MNLILGSITEIHLKDFSKLYGNNILFSSQYKSEHCINFQVAKVSHGCIVEIVFGP